MNPQPVRNPHRRASTLLMVLVLSAATLLILASTLGWATTNLNLNGRNNEYFRTLAVAEAATEKVLASIASDYQNGGDAAVLPNISSYRSLVPTASENPIFGSYTFNDAQGQVGKTYIQHIPPAEFRQLNAQYKDLYGFSAIYRVISNARENTGRFKITAACWQDIETATIPLFQFAIFYTPVLEINPGANMTVNGPVHCNLDIHADPGATLTFQGDVTAAGEIINKERPGDPNTTRNGTLVFQSEHDSGLSTLNLPIGVDNSPEQVRKVVEPPPSGEDPNSPLGKQRFYNKADVIVTVRNTGVTVTSGILNNKDTDVTLSSYTSGSRRWVNTSTTLFNKRENKTVRAVTIDVADLLQWNSSGSNTLPVRPITGGTKDVTIVYVDDQRTMNSSEQPGVLVKNGRLLPPHGLTIASPEPIYVHGHYNVQDSSGERIGSSDTSRTRPAALIGDAITVLSERSGGKGWDLSDPNYGNKPFDQRIANPTTVNAAFLAGIVETTSGQYSGGVENFPRFLEDWSGKNFHYNGSMVVMYASQIADALWRGTGSSIGIYDPPNRVWAFDRNFKDPNKLPPGTPSVRVLIRGAWASIKPNTTTINDPDALIP